MEYEEVLSYFNLLQKKVEKASNKELATISVDKNFKNILKFHKTIEVIAFISKFSYLMEDSRNIYDELIQALEIPELRFDVLRLIFFLSQNSDFVYDEFNNDILNLIEETNKLEKFDEEFLFFIILSSEKATRKKEHEFIDNLCLVLIQKISDLSIKISQNILYTILTIMRIHPSSFILLKENKTLVSSKFDQVSKKLVERLFLEFNDKPKRPKKVFLNNFSFPRN